MLNSVLDLIATTHIDTSDHLAAIEQHDAAIKHEEEEIQRSHEEHPDGRRRKLILDIFSSLFARASCLFLSAIDISNIDILSE